MHSNNWSGCLNVLARVCNLVECNVSRRPSLFSVFKLCVHLVGYFNFLLTVVPSGLQVHCTLVPWYLSSRGTSKFKNTPVIETINVQKGSFMCFL